MKALRADERFSVCGLLLRSPGQAVPDDIPVYTEAEGLLQGTHPDVWLDFTDARSVVANVDLAITYGVRPVVGATGYTEAHVEAWNRRLLDQESGGVAAPNFAIGALLMMRFAAEAAQFLNGAEIVELHHDGKRDAPSGTARRTASIISQAAGNTGVLENAGDESSPALQSAAAGEVQPSRGLLQEDVRIHSVRLPGLVAHQEVIFGGQGEVLTIRHDSLSRISFMPGVLLACSQVGSVKGMVYGLEHLLW